MWLDQLRDLLAAHLAGASIGVLSVAEGATLPVWYQSEELMVRCLVPRWSDAAEVVHHSRAALLIVPATPDPRCWLRYHGEPHLALPSAWVGPWPDALTARQAGERWLLVTLTPQRLDLFDERRGWGARETLDLVRLDQTL